MAYTIYHYATRSGVEPVRDFLRDLADHQGRRALVTRLARLALGQFGDCGPCGIGVWELRIHSGPGYRVYYSVIARDSVLLLLAGRKKSQGRDIPQAIRYLCEFEEGR